jgi:hypothetical protein
VESLDLQEDKFLANTLLLAVAVLEEMGKMRLITVVVEVAEEFCLET